MFLIAYTLVIVFFLCAWVYKRWLKVSRYWLERGVPHNAPHLIYGSLSFFMKENPAVFLKRIYKENKVPYIGIWSFWRPALMVNDPDLARRILVKDSDNFRNRSLNSGKSDPIGALNIFTTDDPLWSTVRRRLTPAFTSAKLRANEAITIAKTMNLIQRMKTETEMGKIVDLRTVYADFTTDVIGEAAFGVTSNATLTGTSTIRNVTEEYMKYNTFRGLAWMSIFFLPQVVDLFGFSLFPKMSNIYLTKVFRLIVDQRGGYEKEVKEAKDIFDMLLKLKQEVDYEGQAIPEEVLVAQAAALLQGGFDTTAVALTYATYHLAFSPETQEKLYKEVIEKKKFTNDKLNSTILAEMPYLNATMKETLRLYPAMGWLDRIAQTDYQIDDKLTIPAGTPVYVNSIGMQVDPEYYPEPDKFNPDRFLPEFESGIVPYSYMPFGEGPRSCIARRFAQQNFRWALATLVENFEFKPYPGFPKPADVGLEKKGMFLMPAETLSVNITLRK